MRFTPQPRRLQNQVFFAGLAAAALFLGGPTAMAQYGASPSQTGMFFNDLRSRVKQQEQAAGVRSGEAVYDYSRGVYLGNANEERPMGEEIGRAHV